jgi:hypothetical protein
MSHHSFNGNWGPIYFNVNQTVKLGNGHTCTVTEAPYRAVRPIGGIKEYLYFFMTNSTRRGWGVSVTPRPLFAPQERPGTPCTGGWVCLGPVWPSAKNLFPTGIRSPDRPARSSVAIPTELPGPQSDCTKSKNKWPCKNTFFNLVV